VVAAAAAAVDGTGDERMDAVDDRSVAAVVVAVVPVVHNWHMQCVDGTMMVVVPVSGRRCSHRR